MRGDAELCPCGALLGNDPAQRLAVGQRAVEHADQVVRDRQVVHLGPGIGERRDGSARAEVVVVVVRLHAQHAARAHQIWDAGRHRGGA